MSEHSTHDEHVPHEPEVDAAIDDQLKRTSDHAAIADLAAPSAAYVEAEAIATRAAVNGILDVLRDAGLIPAS